MRIKKEIRTIGIDDGPFHKPGSRKVIIVGTIFRGGQVLDGVISSNVTVDGNDSTKKIVEMINRSKFKLQLKAIFLHGISVGGFNVIDVEKLHKLTGIPVIIVIRAYPDYEKIYKTLKILRMEKKIKLIEKVPRPKKFNDVYIQHVGINEFDAKAILNVTCSRALIPEPLRAAHLIAAGIVKGESKGRA